VPTTTLGNLAPDGKANVYKLHVDDTRNWE